MFFSRERLLQRRGGEGLSLRSEGLATHLQRQLRVLLCQLLCSPTERVIFRDRSLSLSLRSLQRLGLRLDLALELRRVRRQRSDRLARRLPRRREGM